MRQLRRSRLSAPKNLAPESVGRVVPALKNPLPCEHLGSMRCGGASYLACDHLHEDERGGRKRWKRASCSASSKGHRGWPSCETSQPGEGAATHPTGRKTLKM